MKADELIATIRVVRLDAATATRPACHATLVAEAACLARCQALDRRRLRPRNDLRAGRNSGMGSLRPLGLTRALLIRTRAVRRRQTECADERRGYDERACFFHELIPLLIQTHTSNNENEGPQRRRQKRQKGRN